MQCAVGFLTLLYVETSFLLNSDLGATNRTMGRVADAESAVTDLQKSLLDSERDVCVCVCVCVCVYRQCMALVKQSSLCTV